MKIGDTFVQDGRTYKVVSENEAGLISKVVTEDEVKVEAIETAPKRRTRKTTESV